MSNHSGPVPAWLNSQYLKSVLGNLEKFKNLPFLNVKISAGSNEGDNYACQIFRITISSSDDKRISIIGKYKVDTEVMKSLETAIDMFDTEARFFRDVCPLFQNILKKSDIEFLPHCYHVDMDKKIIFMEDLVTLNYILQPRTELLNKEQSILVIKALADMHGASFKVLQVNPKLKNQFKNTLWNSNKNDVLDKFSANGQNCLNKCMHLYDLPQRYKEKLSKVREELEVDWLKVCDLQEDNLNVLLHGDCWKNNMMFHYTDNVVDKVKLLDYQGYNYSCFANDLHYFLFSSVANEVLLNDIDNLLHIYYNRLTSVAPEIPNLTFDRIKKEFSDRYYFSFVLTVIFRSFIVSETIPDLDKIVGEQEVSMGFDSPAFTETLQLLLPLFEKVGII